MRVRQFQMTEDGHWQTIFWALMSWGRPARRSLAMLQVQLLHKTPLENDRNKLMACSQSMS